MKRLWVGLLIMFMVVEVGQCNTATAQDRQKEGEGVRFKWAFGALKEGEGAPQLVAINRDAALKAGDELKMLVELKEKCYAYVIYQGPQGEIRLLFPYELSDLEKGYQESKVYYVPKGGGWFELDSQVGQETFHLLASAERLITLEKLLKDYESAGSENKPFVAQDLLEEIQQLRRTNRNLKAPAERPAQIVGRIRGSGEPGPTNRPDIEPLAVEISAESFYSRTFTIDHK
jgi:hypothetical protein